MSHRVCPGVYRWQKATAEEPKPRPTPPRALRPEERREVREVLNSEEFVDHAPAQVYASLLDRGVYLCSVRTMYRILEENWAMLHIDRASRDRPRRARAPGGPPPTGRRCGPSDARG